VAEEHDTVVEPRLADVRDEPVVEVAQVDVEELGADNARDRTHVHFVSFAATSRTRNAGGPAVVPPSIGSNTPVICAARSLARNTTALATSSVCPRRCSG